MPSATVPPQEPTSELHAFALSTLFGPRAGFHEAMANLTPTQLELLERSVERVKQLRGQEGDKSAAGIDMEGGGPSLLPATPASFPPQQHHPMPLYKPPTINPYTSGLLPTVPNDPRAMLAYQTPVALQSLSQLYAPLLSAQGLNAQAYAHVIMQAHLAQAQGQTQNSQKAQPPNPFSLPNLVPIDGITPHTSGLRQPQESSKPYVPPTKGKAPAKAGKSNLQSDGLTRSTSGGTMPGTVPQSVEIRNGVEWVTFTYTVKGNTKVHTIRTDIDSIQLDGIGQDFKRGNSVYPRANCAKEEYTGNRWEYETSVNELGWKLTFLNHEVMANRRGLIQRAVDSVRNRFPELRSRRVIRQEKLIKGTLRKRPERPPDDNLEESAPKRLKTEIKSIEFESIASGMAIKTRVRVDLESASLATINDEFRQANAVFPRALCARDAYEGAQGGWVRDCAFNEMAWRLVVLNPKLAGKKVLLQRALDAYRQHFTDRKPRPGKARAEAGMEAPDVGGRGGGGGGGGGEAGAVEEGSNVREAVEAALNVVASADGEGQGGQGEGEDRMAVDEVEGDA